MEIDITELRKKNMENIMGTKPVGELILKMSLPMMFSMLVQSLYSIVDSIFVARIAEDALTAVTLAMPLQSVMTAITVGLSVGVNTVLSRCLGENDKEGVSCSAGNGLLIEWAVFAFFLVTGLLAVKPFFATQTDSPQIYQYGVEYTRIVFIYSFGVVNQVIMERLLISTGKTLCSMASLLTGAIVNTILDPILIFGLLGFHAMGIKGAAYATVIAQTAAAIVGTLLNLTVNKEIRLNPKSFIPRGRILKEILIVGMPAVLSNAANSVVTFGINRILMSFTSTATAVYGVYVRLQGFAMMPVYGIRNTVVSIIAYNYGARHKARIIQAIKICMASSITITSIVTATFILIPEGLLSIFDAQEYMIQIGSTALRIIGLGIPFAGVTVIYGATFQSFGESNKELIVSVIRVAVLLTLAWLLSLTARLEIVWWAFAITEIIAFMTALKFRAKIKKKYIDNL